jgi:biotin carboxyl carrier protein
MERYRITVNGESYEVEIEKIKVTGSYGKAAAPAMAAKAPVAAVPAKLPESIANNQAPKTAGNVVSRIVTAPMPGTVIALNVNKGDYISEGQVVLVLEAMKMENEIKLPYSGKVVEVLVATGQRVNAGEALLTVQPGERRIS